MTGMRLAVGLMSGTSLDGVDAALIESDGHRAKPVGRGLTLAYPKEFIPHLRKAVKGDWKDIPSLEKAVTEHHAEAVKKLLEENNLSASDIEVIGFHGQTVYHAPELGITWQIGNGALLAELTGIDVVADFRRRDVAAGGEGAPLVPLYHAALAHDLPKPLAIVNIGGLANVTWIGEGAEEIIAFDTGPGNALLNDWINRHTGGEFDADGRVSLAGKVDEARLAKALAHPYFQRPVPKSLDREAFGLGDFEGLSLEDGAATIVAFVGASILKAREHFPAAPEGWYITGGGRHNPAIMQSLGRGLNRVEPVEALGWNGDLLEAEAFAYLALRSIAGLPLSLPTTTGVSRAVTGGAFYRAWRAGDS